ncbi:MAG TPA: YcbK family protein [Steroidobacteraceae bacterium]|nr:YcbK family protein [Steroidobacteraceae bacterium]
MSSRRSHVPEQPVRPPQLGRRRFLSLAGGLCGSVAGFAVAPVLAATRASRCLSFVHTHTGERLRAVYFRDGCYQPDSLSQVNRLLRDFRTGDVHPIDPGLLDILFELQIRADRDDAFEVISGYRSPATNALLHSRSEGVAVHSMHLEGRAIDVRLPGCVTRDLAGHARSLGLGGVGFYARSDFVHVDTGRVRFW